MGVYIHHKNQWDDYSGPDFHSSIEEAQACEKDHVIVLSLKDLEFILGEAQKSLGTDLTPDELLERIRLA